MIPGAPLVPLTATATATSSARAPRRCSWNPRRTPRSGARIYARFSGYQVCSAGRNRQYSHDAPELDLRPCVRAFRAVLAEAEWEPDSVDLINANGSSSIIYDRLESLALSEVFGASLAQRRVHSIKSTLGQHGAGSSALQAVAACLSIRRGSVPPTINHENPDPTCAPLSILTKGEAFRPSRVLVHSIGLGGFYYSVGAFEALDHADRPTGLLRVAWSKDADTRFAPSEEFQKPLVPWRPRQD